MSKAPDPDDGRDIEVPDMPDFSRLPYRSPEEAIYRVDDDSVPPRVADNPLYLALPRPRKPSEVRTVLEAENPPLDPEVRNHSPEVRRERIDDLDPAVCTLRRHIQLEEMVMSTIRNSFAYRPWHGLYIETAAQLATGIGQPASAKSNHRGGAVGAGSLFGDVGLGKTLAMTSLLMACPQTILHVSFRGRRLGIQQVVWLYLSMPPKASAYGLLAWIASILDYSLKTSYRNDLDRSRNHTAQVRIIARALAIHAVGVIFCDELQNIEVGSKSERMVFENTLQELINYTHTRWVFIGTKAARQTIQSSALQRRMCGERGQIIWEPMAPGPEWDEFFKWLLSRLVTRRPTPFDQRLSVAANGLTGGVPDNAKRLITAAESNIIGHSRFPEEQLTTEILEKTMKENFPNKYDCVRTRYKDLLSKFDREQSESG
jgi:hypothetical protein